MVPFFRARMLDNFDDFERTTILSALKKLFELPLVRAPVA